MCTFGFNWIVQRYDVRIKSSVLAQKLQRDLLDRTLSGIFVKLNPVKQEGARSSGVASPKIWGGQKILGKQKCLILGE